MARRFTRLSQNDILNPARHKYQLDKLMTDTETTFDAQAQLISDLAAAVADIATAQAAAAAAQTAADTVKRDDSISTSWTSPGVILSATDAGSNATITIANHTRKYTDNTQVSVTGGTLTALSYSALYYLYYDQASRAGGAVTYQTATDPNVALANAIAGRHFCGFITTPGAGGAATDGGVDPPGGAGQIPKGAIP